MKKQEDLLKRLKEHQPIIVVYKGEKEFKDYAIWDEEIQKYRDDMGIWDTKLLIEIAKNEVKNTELEIPNET